jgi:hypothetical protein
MINPLEVPDTPAAQRAAKEARLREVESRPHPTDGRDGPSPEVEGAVTPEVQER